VQGGHQSGHSAITRNFADLIRDRDAVFGPAYTEDLAGAVAFLASTSRAKLSRDISLENAENRRLLGGGK
jgi:hypothetical protein